MENEQINNIKRKDLLTVVEDYLNSHAVKLVISKVTDDNWSVTATVPKSPKTNP